jgi:hypothetical protein
MQVEIGHPPHCIRCSRLLYRWLSDNEVGKPRYRSKDARQPDEPQEATSRQVGALLTGKDVGPADGNAEPQHPILVEPWTYELERIDWRPSPAIAESFLDLTFRRGSERRRLRFLSPTQVKVDQGFCGQSYGLAIHDIRRRGWDGVRIEVVNFEAAPGITFFAADVVDLDQSEGVQQSEAADDRSREGDGGDESANRISNTETDAHRFVGNDVGQTTSLADLSHEDRDLVRRSLEACGDGPFFADWEFHTLFGLTRPEFREAARRWTDEGRSDPEVRLAIANALMNLRSYPHGMDGRLEQDFGVSRARLVEVCRRFRTL